MLFGALLAVIAGSCLPVTFFLFGRIISEFSAFTVAQNASAIENYFCNQTLVDKYVTASNATNQVLMGEVQNNMLYIIGVCLILFMTTSASNLAWSVSAINRSNRMRVAFLRAVLNQNISWYDLHPPQQLLTRLTSDIQKIEDGFGVTTVKFIKEFTTVIVGLVIAFILNWKLTLSIACSFPLLLIGIIFMTKVCYHSLHNNYNLIT
jgi:ABC-type multidrug transport system fused ATPase/permease subunit